MPKRFWRNLYCWLILWWQLATGSLLCAQSRWRMATEDGANNNLSTVPFAAQPLEIQSVPLNGGQYNSGQTMAIVDPQEDVVRLVEPNDSYDGSFNTMLDGAPDDGTIIEGDEFIQEQNGRRLPLLRRWSGGRAQRLAPLTSFAQQNGSVDSANWEWQFHPVGLIYRPYLASVSEPHMMALFENERQQGWLFDGTVGGRFGVLRYGDDDPLLPNGWEVDIEAAATPRLSFEEEMDLIGTDFRVGVPISYGAGMWRTKFGYYHLSSHIGDEFLLKHPTFNRLNYVRETIVLGEALQLSDAWRLYAEVGYAFHTDGGSEPWELQFGVEYSPFHTGRAAGFFANSFHPRGKVLGSPFAAVHGHLREENNFSGNVTLQTGWQWRNLQTGSLLRVGFHFLSGNSEQHQFFRIYEQQVGAGIWYDF